MPRLRAQIPVGKPLAPARKACSLLLVWLVLNLSSFQPIILSRSIICAPGCVRGA